MKTKSKFSSSILLLLVLVLAITICIVSSCEKHDDIQYFKSKCVAELNGQTLIDQTPFNIGPNSINTPSLDAGEYTVEFNSNLSNERGGTPLYAVTVKLFVNSPLEYLTQPQTIKYVNIGKSDDEPARWDYIKYCNENKISYATILSYSDYKTEIVKEGSFKITSYDKEKNVYTGIYTLKFSEGTLNAEFSIN